MFYQTHSRLVNLSILHQNHYHCVSLTKYIFRTCFDICSINPLFGFQSPRSEELKGFNSVWKVRKLLVPYFSLALSTPVFLGQKSASNNVQENLLLLPYESTDACEWANSKNFDHIMCERGLHSIFFFGKRRNDGYIFAFETAYSNKENELLFVQIGHTHLSLKLSPKLNMSQFVDF